MMTIKEGSMTDIIVSVADFKAHLSRILSESRSSGKRIVIMNRKRPIATVLPYDDNNVTAQPGSGGLASLAGTWNDLEEITSDIEYAYASRRGEDFREISF